MRPDVATWDVYLPATPGGWFDFWTGKHRAGQRTHAVPSPLTQIPLHVKAGTILPLGPLVQSTVDATNRDLEIHIFPGADGRFEL